MKFNKYFLILMSLIGSLTLAGCENLPGTREQQTTAGGAVAGAAAGAAIAEDSLFGAIMGGLAGAAGGYLIGARTDWFEEDNELSRDRLSQALEEARRNPATPAEALAADTADINNDGLVTTDEVLAMQEAGLSDRQILARLEATDQVFDLTQDQRDRLVAAGLSRQLVDQFENVNSEQRELLSSSPEVIGGPA